MWDLISKFIKSFDHLDDLLLNPRTDKPKHPLQISYSKNNQAANEEELCRITLPSPQTVYQYAKVLGVPLSIILDKLNTDGFRCFPSSELVPRSREILDNMYRDLQSDPNKFV
ncbi:hypothetical protein GO003_020875 [Methylicorpusculum oleiharenae]|uniref:hypothetical protein n=1 Tax=Methylicorpusculum oleiharenae TaxID=1338687 RepID=UPI00135AF06D|nr:hypothetical protein [Methylicorpusculum oleiharenae]MCD2452842.1 hypothetical protein [Methylicorpusculum oleiharenae]